MAKIQINGKKVALRQNFSILEVLKKYKLNRKKVAIELNGKIIKSRNCELICISF